MATAGNRWRHPSLALVLPLALLALGVWQVTRIAGDADAYDARAGRLQASMDRLHAMAARNPNATVRFEGDPQTYQVQTILPRIEDERDEFRHDALVDRVRGWAAWTAVAGGAVALLAVLACLLMSAQGAIRGKRSRTALVSSFHGVVRALPFVLSCVAGATALATLGAVLFEVGGAWFFEGFSTGELKLILAGLAVAVGALLFAVNSIRQLRRALDAFTPTPMDVLGRAVTPGEAPGLWAFLHDLAGRQGAPVPDNVVLGLTEGFFVTSSPVRIAPEKRVLTGHSLYLPAAFLPLLNRAEITAVVAHELAHFTGEDTQYSQRFLPLYASMSRSMQAVTRGKAATAGMDAIFHPAAILAEHAMGTFRRLVSHWSRLREFEADRASLLAGSERGAATALIRTGMGQGIIAGTLNDIYQQPSRANGSVVDAVLARAGAAGFTAPAGHLEDRQPHPTDTHPPTRQRIEALGVAIDDALLAEASRPVQAAEIAFAESLFADWPAIHGLLGADLVRLARERDRQYVAQLQEAAAADLPDTPVHERTRSLRYTLAVLALLFFAAAAGILAVALTGSDAADATLIMVVAATAGLIGLVFLGFAVQAYRRGSSGPFLVVGATGFCCDALAEMVPWSDVAALQVSVGRGFVTTVALRPEAPMPRKTGRRLTLKLDGKKRVIRLSTAVPRDMKPQAYLDLLNRALRADRAKAALRALEAENRRPAA